MDSTEPDLESKLWHTGGVEGKRAQIRQLILDLSQHNKNG